MTDFVLSKLLRGYAADGGFTGSSMGRAIEAAENLEVLYYGTKYGCPIDSDAAFRRLSVLLRYMQAAWGYEKSDMETAARWAKRLEDITAGLFP